MAQRSGPTSITTRSVTFAPSSAVSSSTASLMVAGSHEMPHSSMFWRQESGCTVSRRDSPGSTAGSTPSRAARGPGDALARAGSTLWMQEPAAGESRRSMAACSWSQALPSRRWVDSPKVGSVTSPMGSIWKYASMNGSIGPLASGDGVTDEHAQSDAGSWKWLW